MDIDSHDLGRLYGERFDGHEVQRDATWRILCHDFFAKWIPRESTVLDIAAGHCEFINNVEAGRRIAVDLNAELPHRAGPGVETYITRSTDLAMIADASIDRVFISNFFEHVDRTVILATLLEACRVLRPDGLLLVLQPNIRFAAKDYWMFFDHITPIDDRAIVEAFAHTGFELVLNIPRFLPYSTKSRLPSWAWIVRLYLRLRPAWRIFGAQSFLVARPAGGLRRPAAA